MPLCAAAWDGSGGGGGPRPGALLGAGALQTGPADRNDEAPNSVPGALVAPGSEAAMDDDNAAASFSMPRAPGAGPGLRGSFPAGAATRGASNATGASTSFTSRPPASLPPLTRAFQQGALFSCAFGAAGAGRGGAGALATACDSGPGPAWGVVYSITLVTHVGVPEGVAPTSEAALLGGEAAHAEARGAHKGVSRRLCAYDGFLHAPPSAAAVPGYCSKRNHICCGRRHSWADPPHLFIPGPHWRGRVPRLGYHRRGGN
jgi:hypothetical protein